MMIADLSEFQLQEGVYSPVSPMEEQVDPAPPNDMTSLYFAAAIADSTGEGARIIGAEGVERAKEYADITSRENQCDGMLFSAAILHIAEERNTELEQRAVSCTVDRLKNDGVHRMNADGVELAIQMVERLGYWENIPPLTAETFDVDTRLDRYHAWQILALLPYIENDQEIKRHYKREIIEAGKFLKNPDNDALLSEVVAAYKVPGSGTNINELPDGLLNWLESVRGCGNSETHYRASLDVDFCVLQDSWLGLISGLIPR
ncbi:hypothetical protein [Streptomyces sp. ST2-7A]|uniref:hypothetical protein n=1 Tax=Streptomyces sp. ST2-7A TaxID=2907214 RepID=UPI001F261683|nr:hypothetical protein [Streptomyces sp. ST2-7A]MCE7078682.1 hypothetical protein [Streptomyces sp. ST2-7A]